MQAIAVRDRDAGQAGIAELGYGPRARASVSECSGWPTGLRDDTPAEYVAIEARNLAPLPTGVDHAVAAGAVISGLAAWQALFDDAHRV